MTVADLKDVRVELNRFGKKLKEAIERFEKDEHAKYGCKESGAVKRGAMDLKRELTKITR